MHNTDKVQTSVSLHFIHFLDLVAQWLFSYTKMQVV